MAPPLPFHEQLAGNVWRLAIQREQIDQLLQHITELEHQAIALAAAYGVKKNTLAILTELSPQRISQITADTDLTGIEAETINRQVRQLEEYPGEARRDANAQRSKTKREDPDTGMAQRRKYALVYGEQAAARRYPSPTDSTEGEATDGHT